MARVIAIMLVALFLFSFLFGCIKVSSKDGGIQIGLAGQEESEEQAPPPAEIPKPPCMDLGEIGARDACFSEMALNLSSEDLCIYTYDEMAQDECLRNFMQKGAKVCGMFVSASYADECWEYQANMSANFSYCERISTQKQRDKCARKVILPCSDAAMSESEKGRCLAWEYSDYKLCADGACLFDYATEFSLMAACDEIKEEGERLTCKSVLSKNPVCSEASQTAVADYCYAQVAERLNESYWCGLASEKSTYKSECIKKLAVMQGNFQICKDADTTIIEDDCYYNYAKSSNAPQACEGIFSETKKDSCYRETALAYRYMSHCNGIVSAYARSLCFSAVAFGNATIKISRGGCADVNDAIWKDKCYMEAAVEWMDKNICKSIAASGVRSSCRSKFI